MGEKIDWLGALVLMAHPSASIPQISLEKK
jgi:hypothetical protein